MIKKGGYFVVTYVDIIKKWKEKKIDSIEKLDQQLSNFRIIFAYNSGAIENSQITYHDTREIFENGKVVNFSGDTRTIFEIENQRKCYNYLAPKIINKDPITSDFVKNVHYQLMQGAYDERRWARGERPGQYKIHDYVIGQSDQGALPEEVPSEIEELCDEILNIPDKGENILKTAAYIHYKFENIHAFADGNGRVGRTLMNYYLMINNYPPLVVYSETKDQYYKALDHYDNTGDITPFLNYMKKSLEKTWVLGQRQSPKNTLQDLHLEQ